MSEQSKYVPASISLERFTWNEEDTPDLRITVGHETHSVRLWRKDVEELKKMGVPLVVQR